AGLLDFLDHGLGRGARATRAIDGTAEIVDDDLGAALCQLERVHLAEPGARTRDDCDLTLEIDAHFLLPWPVFDRPAGYGEASGLSIAFAGRLCRRGFFPRYLCSGRNTRLRSSPSAAVLARAIVGT